MQRRQRTVYLVTIVAMVAMIGGYALAATTLSGLPAQTSNVTSGTPGGFALATVASEQLVVVSTAMSTATAAGTQGAGVALSGTTFQLTACAASPAVCAGQSLKAATPAAVVGDYGEQLSLNVAQSAANSGLGFDMAITVVTSTTTIVAFAYIELPTTANANTIPVFLFVDLGSAAAPIVNSVSVVFNQCSTGTSCP
jgi:hypothetical protein